MEKSFTGSGSGGYDVFLYCILQDSGIEDMNGWWYENEDGSYCKNGWFWLDGNEDGEAECYCFDNDGYALVSLYNLPTSKAAGYDVNMDGAWVENGEVQTQPVME